MEWVVQNLSERVILYVDDYIKRKYVFWKKLFQSSLLDTRNIRQQNSSNDFVRWSKWHNHLFVLQKFCIHLGSHEGREKSVVNRVNRIGGGKRFFHKFVNISTKCDSSRRWTMTFYFSSRSTLNSQREVITISSCMFENNYSQFLVKPTASEISDVVLNIF